MNKFVGICVAILSLSVIGQASACDECYGEWKVVSSPLLVRSNDCDCTLTWRKGRVSLVTIDGFCLIKKVGKGVNRGFKKAGKALHDNFCLCPQHRRKGLFNPPALRRIPIIGRSRLFRD